MLSAAWPADTANRNNRTVVTHAFIIFPPYAEHTRVQQRAPPVCCNPLLAVAVSAFPRSNETEVEENQKEDGMDKGAHATDLRRQGHARAQERHRNASQVKIEKNPRVHKEGACKKLADVLPRNSPEQV